MLRILLAACRPRPYNELLIACFPKSGSTYLSKLLQAATGLPEAYVAELGPQNEQDLSRRRLKRLARRSVIQQHFKATETNIDLLREYGIRPVVQTRSLFDTVASLHDHYEREPHSLPCGQFPAGYSRMAYAERLDFLIAAHLPWYMNFYLSWLRAAERIEIFPLTYENLFADLPGSLAALLGFYGWKPTTEQIQSAIRQANGAATRRNVGVSGRGLELLLPRHRQAIAALAVACHLELDAEGCLAPYLSMPASPPLALSRVA